MGQTGTGLKSSVEWPLYGTEFVKEALINTLPPRPRRVALLSSRCTKATRPCNARFEGPRRLALQVADAPTPTGTNRRLAM